MSVTFEIESIATGLARVSCIEDVLVGEAHPYGSDALQAERAAHMAVCEDCRMYGCFTQPIMDVDFEGVQMSNVNCRDIMRALDIEVVDSDLSGTISADDLLARVNIALAIEPADTGIAPAEWREGGPQMIDCGRRAGYLQDKLQDLGRLAAEALSLGRDVQWC